MELTKEEERMLRGDYGEGTAQAIRMIIKVGEALGAKRLVRIAHAHVSGVSYATIGEPGLYWLEELASKGAKARTFATINPIGFDPYSDIIKVDKKFFEGQMRILKAFEKLGFEKSLTCTPYYLRRPRAFERLAWGESSAVIYANSVLGAFTNREGGPVTVAAAITGRIYEAGLQLLENRTTTAKVTFNFKPSDVAEWSASGYVIGEKLGSGIPRIEVRPSVEEAKYMLAASAASGGLAMAVIDELTPPNTYRIGSEERVEVEWKDIEPLFGDVEDAELVFHGCPHVSSQELEYLDKLVADKVRKELWVAIAPELFEKERELVGRLERKGVRFVRGTCMVVAPISKMGIKKIATTSAKTYFYLKRKGFDVWMIRLREVGQR